MLKRIIHTLWGNLEGNELKKYALLAIGFFFLIGSYWPLKTLKDSIFLITVGLKYKPLVKILSIVVLFPLILIYSKLVDYFSKQKMVYLILVIYFIIGLGFVYGLYHPTIGLSNTEARPDRLLGWAFVLYVESYISLMISLYWSFTHDITTPESAKKGYGLIIFGAQFGGLLFTIVGNLLSSDTSRYAERVPLIALISISMFLVVGLVTFILERIVGTKDLQNYEEKIHPKKDPKASVGFLDGLKVLVTRPYVAGIFGLIFFHETISSVMEFQMESMATATYKTAGQIHKFFFDYAFAVQLTACLFALMGTSFFQRRFGIAFCITAYPILLGLSITCYLVYPSLATIFAVMLIAKALNFAFNQPSKESLYIPTSKNIKYKSKAWIDMFGMRCSKGAGHAINQFFGTALGTTGPIIVCLTGVWVMLARAIGNYFNKAVNDKKLIE